MDWDKKVDDVKVSKTYGNRSPSSPTNATMRNDVTTIKLGISLIIMRRYVNLSSESNLFLHNLQLHEAKGRLLTAVQQ